PPDPSAAAPDPRRIEAKDSLGPPGILMREAGPRGAESGRDRARRGEAWRREELLQHTGLMCATTRSATGTTPAGPRAVPAGPRAASARPPRRARPAPARRCRPGGFHARPGVASLPYSGAMTPPQPASSHNAPPGGSTRGEGKDLTRRMDLAMEGGG